MRMKHASAPPPADTTARFAGELSSHRMSDGGVGERGGEIGGGIGEENATGDGG